jgi:hypothetical protein
LDLTQVDPHSRRKAVKDFVSNGTFGQQTNYRGRSADEWTKGMSLQEIADVVKASGVPMKDDYIEQIYNNTLRQNGIVTLDSFYKTHIAVQSEKLLKK